MRPLMIRLALLVLIVGCGIGLYVAVDTAQALPLQHAQANAIARFGVDLLDLCQNTTTTRNSSWPNTVKIGVINSDAQTVYDDYDSVLPAQLKATDRSDVTVLLCLTETKSVFDIDKYGNPAKYTCTRYRRDLTGYLIDVKTGTTINYRSFNGQMPPECPDETAIDISRTGDIPLASDVSTWLTASMGQGV